MANVDDSPDLIYVLLPDGTTDPEEAVRRVVVPQIFSSCGFVPVPLDPVSLQDHVARRVYSQCRKLGMTAVVLDRAQGLYKLSGRTSEGQDFTQTVYVRPMWLNKNHSEQVQ